jgi:hypothetical protein
VTQPTLFPFTEQEERERERERRKKWRKIISEKAKRGCQGAVDFFFFRLNGFPSITFLQIAKG